MPRYEYKVVPAPSRGRKGKGVKGAEARFSYALQELMNGLAGYGWEYQRAETLPSVERSGLTSSTTEWRNVLVFRRLRENDAEAFAPELLPAPNGTMPPEHEPRTEQEIASATEAESMTSNAPANAHENVETAALDQPETAPKDTAENALSDQPDTPPAAEPEPAPADKPTEAPKTSPASMGSGDQSLDNGVEDTRDVRGMGASLSQLASHRNAVKSTD